jgi:flagellar hook protein FlgE
MTLSVELSGLQTAQTNLDTIGNNIANVSTNGFKATTTNFGDLYATSLLGSQSIDNAPGLGASVTSLSQLFTEGSISQTGNPLDVAINGNGFLQVQTPSGIAYTRDGALQTNAGGFLTTDSGATVMGFAPPTSGSTTATTSGPLVPLQISTANLPAAATSTLSMNINLPSTDTPINTVTTPFSVNNPQSYNESTTTTVFDSLGTANSLTTYFTQVSGSGAPPQWQTNWALTGSNGTMVASGAGATLSFNSSGVLASGSGTIAVSNLPDGAAALNITQSFTGSTLSALGFGVNSLANNGNSAGQFVGVQINSDGAIVAQYSNGATQNMGTIALANFANPNGLIASTNNIWLATQASGPPLVNTPGTAGLGALDAGAVEGSNVDLSTQLVDLIVAQQAYQANVQGINVDQQDVQRLLTIQ